MCDAWAIAPFLESATSPPSQESEDLFPFAFGLKFGNFTSSFLLLQKKRPATGLDYDSNHSILDHFRILYYRR